MANSIDKTSSFSSSRMHDVRQVNTYYKELNYGTAVYRRVYCSLGLPDYFRNVSRSYKLDFSYDAVMFAVCYFNIEKKLSDPIDLTNLEKRRCIFDFSEATKANLEQAFIVFKELEHDFVPFVNGRLKELTSAKIQNVKHSPNPKVVLKSLAYLVRCLFIKQVQEAGYKIPKEPLFTLLNQGTLLRPAPEEGAGYVKLNKAFGIYGDSSNPLTVRRLMAIFGIDASQPMRNYAELTKALKVDFPLNQDIKKETPEIITSENTVEDDIDLKEATGKLTHVAGLDFLFAQNHLKDAKRSR